MENDLIPILLAIMVQRAGGEATFQESDFNDRNIALTVKSDPITGALVARCVERDASDEPPDPPKPTFSNN